MKNITPTGEAINRLSFQGHIIPHSWYKQILLGGKPDLVAITILSDIIYYYRYESKEDERTGEIDCLKRFHADKLQRSYGQLSEKFGISKRQAHDACHRLEKQGLITLEFRVIMSGSMPLNNVLYIEPLPAAIEAITFEDTPLPRQKGGVSHAGTGESPTAERGTYTKTTTETTTENKTLCLERHNVSASAEYGESTPPNEEPIPIPSLEPEPETLNVAAPRRRIDAGSGELYPRTPGGALLFSLCGREAAAKGLSMAQRYPSIAMRDKFLEAEQRLGMDGLRGAILKAIEAMGYVSLTRMIQYVSKVAGNGSPAKSTLPPLLFQKVAEAIRYNPEAQEHIPRISRLTETCQQRGYTEEQVRKAGKLWWETWPGNTSKGPSDAEFLQKIEIVKKERL